MKEVTRKLCRSGTLAILTFVVSTLNTTHPFAAEIITPERIRELVERSFDVQASKAKVQQNRAGVIRSFDPYVPDISLNAQSYAFTESYRQNRSPVYLNATFSLFEKGRDIFGIQKARSELREAEQRLEASRKDALIRAYTLYFRLIEAKANLRTISENKKELGAALDRARSLVAAKALGNLQLSRLEVEGTLLDYRLDAANASLQGLRSEFVASLQLDPDLAFDVPPPPSSTVPREYLKATASDVTKAAGNWNQSLALAERSYNIDSPTRWLAYSDQLPKLDLLASLGRADFNTVKNEFTFRANLEIPIPLLDVPIMFKPVNTIVNQELRQNEVRRAEVLADFRADIETRTARLNAAISQLQRLDQPLEDARKFRDVERQEVLVAGGQAFNYLMYLGQIRDLELARNAALRVKETEYRALRVLRGDEPAK